MKIGVTGGTGFIGQWLLKMFSEEETFVVLTSQKKQNTWYEHPHISYVKGTYSKEDMMSAFAGCEALIHLGAVLSDKEREKSFFGYEENIRSSETLFQTAKDLGIQNVVNISSRTVYDHSKDACFQETMIPSPMNYYAVAKLAVEHMAAMYNQKYGVKIKTLRLAQIFGPGGRNGYMMEIFRKTAQAGEKITVFDHQGKELLYVKDAARALICACRQPKKQGIYNVGSGVFSSNAQIADTFCTVYDSMAGYEYRVGCDDVMRQTYMDVSLAKEELGFEAAYSLEEAIRDIRRENEIEFAEKV